MGNARFGKFVNGIASNIRENPFTSAINIAGIGGGVLGIAGAIAGNDTVRNVGFGITTGAIATNAGLGLAKSYNIAKDNESLTAGNFIRSNLDNLGAVAGAGIMTAGLIADDPATKSVGLVVSGASIGGGLLMKRLGSGGNTRNLN